jgi:hypothetical protein
VDYTKDEHDGCWEGFDEGRLVCTIYARKSSRQKNFDEIKPKLQTSIKLQIFSLEKFYSNKNVVKTVLRNEFGTSELYITFWQTKLLIQPHVTSL